MARFKLSALIFLLFGIMAASTHFRFETHSRPHHVLQGIVDTTMVSWLGNSMTALLLLALAVFFPILMMRKSYEPKADLVLKSTGSALKGQIYRPSPDEIKAAKPMFGNRS